jgi:hypothetical protein
MKSKTPRRQYLKHPPKPKHSGETRYVSVPLSHNEMCALLDLQNERVAREGDKVTPYLDVFARELLLLGWQRYTDKENAKLASVGKKA